MNFYVAPVNNYGFNCCDLPPGVILLKQKSINNEWKDIVRIMNTQKIVTTTMENEYDQQIILRQCSEPTDQVNKIYTALKYKSQPFSRKKSVVPLSEVTKNQTSENPLFFSG